MKIHDFIDKLSTLSETAQVRTLLESTLDSFKVDFDITNDQIEEEIKKIEPCSMADLGDNVGMCIGWCEEKLDYLKTDSQNLYSQKVSNFKKLLENIATITIKVTEERIEKSNNEVESANQTAIDQNKEAILELTGDVVSLQKEIKTIVSEADAKIDSKMFQLLVNIVAILGIFVAIAYTGFSTISIISNIDLKTALISEEAFVKNIFFLLLVSTLLYNLLLLLIYFIFKLSRPLLKQKNPNNDNESKEQLDESFRGTINLLPFYIVDGVLALLTVASFLASIWIW